jgi:predicted nucleic acid-binding protein
MPLNLPDGAACFIDSNILYYALVPTTGTSGHCIELLNRAIAGDVRLYVSIPVLSDTVHKIMATEAAQKLGRDRAGIVTFLRNHPDVIATLTEYSKAMDRLRAVPMEILPIDVEILTAATRLAISCSLFTNDAMIVALTQRHQLMNLASNDADFERVPGLVLWKPR